MIDEKVVGIDNIYNNPDIPEEYKEKIRMIEGLTSGGTFEYDPTAESISYIPDISGGTITVDLSYGIDEQQFSKRYSDYSNNPNYNYVIYNDECYVEKQIYDYKSHSFQVKYMKYEDCQSGMVDGKSFDTVFLEKSQLENIHMVPTDLRTVSDDVLTDIFRWTYDVPETAEVRRNLTTGDYDIYIGDKLLYTIDGDKAQLCSPLGYTKNDQQLFGEIPADTLTEMHEYAQTHNVNLFSTKNFKKLYSFTYTVDGKEYTFSVDFSDSNFLKRNNINSFSDFMIKSPEEQAKIMKSELELNNLKCEKVILGDSKDAMKYELQYDERHKLSLTAEEYEEYQKDPFKFLETKSEYKEHVIEETLSETYGKNFIVNSRKNKDGKTVYDVYYLGEFIATMTEDELYGSGKSSGDKTLDSEKIKGNFDGKIGDKERTKINTSVYDNNGKFTRMQKCISVEHEYQYKEIVNSLSSIQAELGNIPAKINSGCDALEPYGSVGNIRDIPATLNELQGDMGRLGGLVDNIVNMYRVCDNDIKKLFDSSIIDDMFNLTGLYRKAVGSDSNLTYTKEYKDTYNNYDDPAEFVKGMTTLIDNMGEALNETYLEYLEYEKNGFVVKGDQIEEMLKNDNNNGTMFMALRTLCGDDIDSINSKQDLINYFNNHEVKMTDTFLQQVAYGVNNDCINCSFLDTESKLDDKGLEIYGKLANSLVSDNETTDFEKYMLIKNEYYDPANVSNMFAYKSLAKVKNYLPIALSEEYDTQLKKVRALQLDDLGYEGWEEYFGTHVSDGYVNIDEIASSYPTDLAMLLTLDKIEAAREYKRFNDEKIPWKSFATSFNNTEEESKRRSLYQDVFGYDNAREKDDWIIEYVNGDRTNEIYYRDYFDMNKVNSFLSTFGDMSEGVSCKDYLKNVINENSKKLAQREIALNELKGYTESGSLTSTQLYTFCENFANSVYKNTVGGLGYYFNPTCFDPINQQAYKDAYIIELLNDSSNMNTVELKYRQGLISENEYSTVKALSKVKVYDGAVSDFKASNKVADTAGMIVGNALMKYVPGGSNFVAALKALNKGGLAVNSYAKAGYTDGEAVRLGLFKAVSIYAMGQLVKKTIGAIGPNANESARATAKENYLNARETRDALENAEDQFAFATEHGFSSAEEMKEAISEQYERTFRIYCHLDTVAEHSKDAFSFYKWVGASDYVSKSLGAIGSDAAMGPAEAVASYFHDSDSDMTSMVEEQPGVSSDAGKTIIKKGQSIFSDTYNYFLINRLSDWFSLLFTK